MFETQQLIDRLFLQLIPFLLCLSVHEWAHAWSAYRLGDDTAEKLGRMTVNPFAHIDPIGTVLLPLMGIPFGWAKPVPINPLRFRRSVSLRWGVLWTALAGPVSNMVLALIFTGIRFGLKRGSHELFEGVLGDMVNRVIVLNLVLAVFNLFPIPPLDGSRIMDALVPEGLRPLWNWYCGLGPVWLMALIFLPMYFHISLIAPVIIWLNDLLAQLS